MQDDVEMINTIITVALAFLARTLVMFQGHIWEG